MATERGVMLETHKVIIDADDHAHAVRLETMLRNGGCRVHREVHRLVHDDGKTITLERQVAREGDSE